MLQPRHLLLFFFNYVVAEKCYSCSSAHLSMRWPKDEETNHLQYLVNFPVYANESCETVRFGIPVIDCPDSVCVKVVIKEPPAKRDVCIQGGAVVRSCWSHVVSGSGGLEFDPKARHNKVRLAESLALDKNIGVIYTCKGNLCNPAPSLLQIASHISYLLLSFRLFL